MPSVLRAWGVGMGIGGASAPAAQTPMLPLTGAGQ